MRLTVLWPGAIFSPIFFLWVVVVGVASSWVIEGQSQDPVSDGASVNKKMGKLLKAQTAPYITSYIDVCHELERSLQAAFTVPSVKAVHDLFMALLSCGTFRHKFSVVKTHIPSFLFT